MTTIITIATQKGGTGKTTSACAIAHGLAMRSSRVTGSTLLIDFDAQAHAAISLGMDQEPCIFDWLVNDAPLANVVRQTTRPGLSLLPGNSRTRTAETVLRMETTLDILISRVYKMAGAWEYIVIDTPPGGLLQELAVRLADMLVIPTVPETLGLDGLAATMQLAQRAGNDPRVIILPTMFDGRLNEHKTNCDLLTRNYPRLVSLPVPARTAVRECAAYGRTVWEHGNGSMADVRDAYTALLGQIACEGGV